LLSASPGNTNSHRSPLCTLALSRYLGFAPSALLTREVNRTGFRLVNVPAGPLTDRVAVVRQAVAGVG
jgi:hypothetical protein